MTHVWRGVRVAEGVTGSCCSPLVTGSTEPSATQPRNQHLATQRRECPRSPGGSSGPSASSRAGDVPVTRRPLGARLPCALTQRLPGLDHWMRGLRAHGAGPGGAARARPSPQVRPPHPCRSACQASLVLKPQSRLTGCGGCPPSLRRRQPGVRTPFPHAALALVTTPLRFSDCGSTRHESAP